MTRENQSSDTQRLENSVHHLHQPALRRRVESSEGEIVTATAACKSSPAEFDVIG